MEPKYAPTHDPTGLEQARPIGDPPGDFDDALNRLAEEDPTKGELVKLRFFGGLTVEQAASVLGISRASAERLWAYARTWLYTELSKGETKSQDS